mmetsp:Transcript_43574/g.78686  ORF Transcript_43574/g.78686 Transcript_43574/m.78686 type:complete len:1451 (+) Transcript_43574:74-4426(+)
MGQGFCSPVAPENIGSSHEELVKAFGDLGTDSTLTFVLAGLTKVCEENSYLKPMGTEPTPHHLLFWVRKCRELMIAGKGQEATICLERITSSLDFEKKQVQDAFRRFDVDGSLQLDASEFRYMCAYIGWGEEEAKMMDKDKDSLITLDEFQSFVGNMGGLQQLFEQRRQRVARKQWGVEAPALIQVGNRVRAYFNTKEGTKSSTWREAQVLELRVMPSNGVLLGFGFEENADVKDWERQVVPQSWIFSDTKDADVVLALREVGILEEQQAFWASIFPQSEMRAVEQLVPCARVALANVRASASALHQAALPKVRQKFIDLGYGDQELQAVLGWVQDLAPMVIHCHIDDVGRFLETDEFYRSQFETGTSCGALDDRNDTRKGWENELFAGAYDECKPFDRCKYGALGVMNDYRGVTSAYQYGDSYLVLKDVRLRTTFAATDSGGIAGSRLAVLDKYAHVLQEYSSPELSALVDVALANTSLDDVPKERPQLLRGMTTDPTAEWITLGYADLPQRRGCFFFEVELVQGTASAQVGFLSTQFVRAPKTKGFLGGVGDDEHGWACDGQHAMLWHAGEKLAWNRCWPSINKILKNDVVIGVAVDLDKQQIWFASDGEWDESPAFGEDRLPKGLALYPALSLQGRAAFNFGPNFKHKAPELSDKRVFKNWPGMPSGSVRVDNQVIGNSNNVSIYKEIQVHGELNLKKNVQRLVANRKYQDMQKSQRSWAVRVDGSSSADGTYARTGARNGMPMYKHNDSDHSLFFHSETEHWRIGKEEAPEDFVAQAPGKVGDFEPPRHGWLMGIASMGRVPTDAFTAGMAKAGISAEDSHKILERVGGSDEKGKQVVFRSSFEDEWDKLWKSSLQSPPMSAEEAWLKAVEEVQQKLLQAKDLLNCQVVQTPEHPYPAKSHSWTQKISIESAKALSVHFSSKCCTYDSCATLNIFAGGMQKSAAGVGARAHIKALSGDDAVHGTFSGKTGLWKVNIDSDEAEICGGFRSWLEEDSNRRSQCFCADDHKVVTVTYSGAKVGDEISGFVLDKSCPLTPFSVAGFAGMGPAQTAGVQVGWYLDVNALLKEKSFRELVGDDLGEAPDSLAEVAEHLEEFGRRLQALRAVSTTVTLVFANGLDYQLLPVCCVSYPAGTLLKTDFQLNAGGENLTVSGLQRTGPAFAAGVRDGWHLNLAETFHQAENEAALKELSREELMKDPAPLLEISDVKLMFEPADANATSYFQGCGGTPSGEGDAPDEDEEGDEDGSSSTPGGPWSTCNIPFNSAQFVWGTDGDGSSYPSRRWGVFAVITPSERQAPSQSAIDSLAKVWAAETARAMGAGSGTKLTVEPEDWDEPRLRALCARHGWEFEWMTEEGEMARRIDGAERARKAGKAATGRKGPEAASADTGAWWRLDSVTAALSRAGSILGNANADLQQTAKQDEKIVQKPDPNLAAVDTKAVKLQTKRA